MHSRWMVSAIVVLMANGFVGAGVPAGHPATHQTSLPGEVTIDFDRPTEISIHAHNASPEAVAQQLTEQMPHGTSVAFFPSKADPAVTLDLDHQPLLVAITKLMTATRREPVQWAFPLHERQLMLQPLFPSKLIPASMSAGAWEDAPISSHGPFLTRLQEITVDRHERFGNMPKQKPTINVTMLFMIEPRLPVLAIASPLRVIEAVDDDGASLMPPASSGDKYWNEQPGQMSTTLSASLLAHGDSVGKSIARFRAVADVRACSAIQTIEIPAIFGPERSIRAGGYRGHAGGIKELANNEFSTRITLNGRGTDQAKWDQWVELVTKGSRFRMLDVSGQAYPAVPSNGVQFSRSYDGELSVTLTFFRMPQQRLNATLRNPSKLIWVAPITAREIEVPIQFEHLALP